MERRTKLFFLVLLLVPCWVIARKYEVDFVILHDTMRLLHDGGFGRIYTENVGNITVGRYFYPPFSLIVFGLFGTVSFVVAKWIWIALQTLWFVLLWRLLGEVYPFLKKPEMRWSWLLVWAMSINPIHNNFQSNNIQLMLFAGLLGAELLIRRGDSRAQFVGGFLSVSPGAIKVYPFFISAYYFVSKPKAVRWGVVAGVLFTTLTPFLVFGGHNGVVLYESFFTNLIKYGQSNPILTTVDIASLPAMMERFFEYGLKVSAKSSLRIATITVGAIAVVFLGYAFGRRKSIARDSRDGVHLWVLAMLLAVLLNSSTRPHYFVFYLPAFCSLCELIADRKLGRKLGWITTIGVLISGALLGLTAEAMVGHQLNDRLEAWCLPAMGMVLLAGLLAWALKATQRDSTHYYR